MLALLTALCEQSMKKNTKGSTSLVVSLTLPLTLRLCFLSPSDDEVVSMADSTVTVDHIEEELYKIERIRDVLVRRESELRYM